MRSRVAVAGLVLALGASGCSGGEEPQAGPTLPPVSEAPTASPDAVPSEAAEATPEGAAEFVRYFYETLERAYEARDPSMIEPLVAPDCETCASIVAAVARLRDENARVIDYEIDVQSADAPSLAAEDARQNVTTSLSFSEFVRVDAQGNETTREPPMTVVQDVELVRQADQWRVTAVIAQ